MKSEDTSPPVRLVSGPQAAKRVLCLGSIVMRGQFELVMAQPPGGTAEVKDTVLKLHRDLIQELNRWLKAQNLWPSLSRREAAMMARPHGEWSEQERIDASWRLEALNTAEWAIGTADRIPAYDESADEKALVRALGLFHPASGFVSRARLRPTSVIARARDTAELWLWRARTTQIQKDPQRYPPPEGLTYEKIIAITAEHAGKEGLFQPVDRDFPAFGKPYSKLAEAEWSTMYGIATERLYGLNWICGYAKDWDKVPTGT